MWPKPFPQIGSSVLQDRFSTRLQSSRMLRCECVGAFVCVCVADSSIRRGRIENLRAAASEPAVWGLGPRD